MAISTVKKILTIYLFVSTEYTNVTDGQTDGQTPHDGTGRACIAFGGKNRDSDTNAFNASWQWQSKTQCTKQYAIDSFRRCIRLMSSQIRLSSVSSITLVILLTQLNFSAIFVHRLIT